MSLYIQVRKQAETLDQSAPTLGKRVRIRLESRFSHSNKYSILSFPLSPYETHSPFLFSPFPLGDYTAISLHIIIVTSNTFPHFSVDLAQCSQYVVKFVIRACGGEWMEIVSGGNSTNTLKPCLLSYLSLSTFQKQHVTMVMG